MSSLVRLIALGLGGLAVAGAVAWGLSRPPSRPTPSRPLVHRIETVKVGETPRAFWLHAPANRPEPAALVLEFHGLGSSAIQQGQLSRLEALSDQERFLLAVPEGIGAEASFNAGLCCGEAVERKFDDVALAAAVIDRVQSQFAVDPKRIFAMGFSNGGFLSQRLACELSDRIAAVASVAGGLTISGCDPKQPVSVLEFHGTDDHHVGYAGGGLAAFPPVQDTMHGWAGRLRCGGLADGWSTDQREVYLEKGDARCERYRGCAGNAEVALCRLDGGGHSWPGGPTVEGLGKTSSDVDATLESWRFFQRHGR